jgi:hypothetical protein
VPPPPRRHLGGGGVAPHNIVLTGTAGLVAGSISMGLGEYTSVRSQNEQVANEVAKERHELARHPDAEAQELAEGWIARGLPRGLAEQVAEVIKRNPEEALRVHTREELGVNPDERPSPWTAAFYSFLCFSVGAAVPLLPYVLGSSALLLALAVGGWPVRGRRLGGPVNQPIVATRRVAAAGGGRRGGRCHLPDRPPDRPHGRRRQRPLASWVTNSINKRCSG